jgi:hypothetical protein
MNFDSVLLLFDISGQLRELWLLASTYRVLADHWSADSSLIGKAAKKMLEISALRVRTMRLRLFCCPRQVETSSRVP